MRTGDEASDFAEWLLAALPELLPPAEAAPVAAELRRLITAGRSGQPVAEALLELVRSNEVLDRAAAAVSGPGAPRRISPPPGRGQPPLATRYVCPVDGWQFFRRDVAQPVPRCPHDGCELLADTGRSA